MSIAQQVDGLYSISLDSNTDRAPRRLTLHVSSWRLTIIALVLLSTPCAGSLIGPQAPSGQAGLTMPVVKSDSLLNGLRLMLIENTSSADLRLHLRVNSGAMFDLAGKGGLADLTAGMLLRGGGGLSAKNVEETVQHLGVRISVTTGWDATDIVMTGPAGNFESMLDLCAKLAVNPGFEQTELEALKRSRIELLKRDSANAGESLKHKALGELFGSYPFGHPERGTSDTVSKVDRGDLVYYHNRFYLPNNSELMITGETTLEEVTRLSRAKLGAWRKGDIVPATFRQPELPGGLKLVVVNDPISRIAKAIIAQPGFSRRANDYYAAAVLTEVLAASNKRLAASMGADVSIETSAHARYLAGPILIAVQSPTDKLHAALDAVMKTLNAFKGGRVDAQEVESAKQRVIEAFNGRLRTPAGIEEALLENELYGLGRDYVIRFEERVSAVTSADCAQAAQKYLMPQNSVIAALGTAKEIEPALKRLLSGGAPAH